MIAPVADGKAVGLGGAVADHEGAVGLVLEGSNNLLVGGLLAVPVSVPGSLVHSGVLACVRGGDAICTWYAGHEYMAMFARDMPRFNSIQSDMRINQFVTPNGTILDYDLN